MIKFQKELRKRLLWLWIIITLFWITLLIWPIKTLMTIAIIISILLFVIWIWTLFMAIKYWWFLARWWGIISSIIDIILAIEIINSPETSTITIMKIFMRIAWIWLIIKWIAESQKSLNLKWVWYKKWLFNLAIWILMLITWIIIFIYPNIWIFTITSILSIICILYWIYLISFSLQIKKMKQINEKLDWKEVIQMN